jgi:hypothetical protein
MDAVPLSRNFKVRVSNAAPQEGFQKSHFREGIFGNKKADHH